MCYAYASIVLFRWFMHMNKQQCGGMHTMLYFVKAAKNEVVNFTTQRHKPKTMRWPLTIDIK